MKKIDIHTSRGWKQIPVWAIVLPMILAVLALCFLFYKVIIPSFYSKAAKRWDEAYWDEDYLNYIYHFYWRDEENDQLYAEPYLYGEYHFDEPDIIIQENISKFYDTSWIKHGLQDDDKDSEQALFARKYKNIQCNIPLLPIEYRQIFWVLGDAYFERSDEYTEEELAAIKSELIYYLTCFSENSIPVVYFQYYLWYFFD